MLHQICSKFARSCGSVVRRLMRESFLILSFHTFAQLLNRILKEALIVSALDHLMTSAELEDLTTIPQIRQILSHAQLGIHFVYLVIVLSIDKLVFSADFAIISVLPVNNSASSFVHQSFKLPFPSNLRPLSS